jgi:hypothetical protein
MVAWRNRIRGAVKGWRHRAHEAKRMGRETGQLTGLMTTGLMDSKADEQALLFQMPRQRRILLLTTTRQGPDKSPARKRMSKVLTQWKPKRLDKQRS